MSKSGENTSGLCGEKVPFFVILTPLDQPLNTPKRRPFYA